MPTKIPGAPTAVISVVDWLLHPARRAAMAQELRQARIAVGTAALLFVGGLIENVILRVLPTPPTIVTIATLTMSTNVAAVVLLRFGRGKLIAPVLLTSAPLAALLLFMSLHHGGDKVCLSPWNIAVVLYLADLVGPRAAVAMIALLCGEAVATTTLELHGWSIPGDIFPPGAAGMRLVEYSSVVGYICVGGLLWLYASSRVAALRALDQALGRAAMSEANLSTMIENTDAMVASIDTQGRWVMFNRALREHLSRRFGQEPQPGEDMMRNLSPEHAKLVQDLIARALSGEQATAEQHYTYGGHETWAEVSYSPIPGAQPGTTRGVTFLGHDITARKQSEEKLRELNRQLVDASRQAGMAEVATGILHNVGNTLNSVNVAAGLALTKLRSSRIASLHKLLELLRAHEHDLSQFLSDDPKGRMVLPFLFEIGAVLSGERSTLLVELETLATHVDHIMSIVSAQQQHAKACGLTEEISLAALLDDAVHLHEASFTNSGIEIERAYSGLLPMLVDRHKVLQIIVNLLQNARHALVAQGRTDKRLRILIDAAGLDRVRVCVIDNGVGIAPDHLARMFQHGFTTKKDGHGFGLHMSVLMAQAMGGFLTCASAGLGQGATFTLELPLRPLAPEADKALEPARPGRAAAAALAG
jgi:two-component system sensor kinase FixL